MPGSLPNLGGLGIGDGDTGGATGVYEESTPPLPTPSEEGNVVRRPALTDRGGGTVFLVCNCKDPLNAELLVVCESVLKSGAEWGYTDEYYYMESHPSGGRPMYGPPGGRVDRWKDRASFPGHWWRTAQRELLEELGSMGSKNSGLDWQRLTDSPKTAMFTWLHLRPELSPEEGKEGGRFAMLFEQDRTTIEEVMGFGYRPWDPEEPLKEQASSEFEPGRNVVEKVNQYERGSERLSSETCGVDWTNLLSIASKSTLCPDAPSGVHWRIDLRYLSAKNPKTTYVMRSKWASDTIETVQALWNSSVMQRYLRDSAPAASTRTARDLTVADYDQNLIRTTPSSGFGLYALKTEVSEDWTEYWQERRRVEALYTQAVKKIRDKYKEDLERVWNRELRLHPNPEGRVARPDNVLARVRVPDYPNPTLPEFRMPLPPKTLTNADLVEVEWDGTVPLPDPCRDVVGYGGSVRREPVAEFESVRRSIKNRPQWIAAKIAIERARRRGEEPPAWTDPYKPNPDEVPRGTPEEEWPRLGADVIRYLRSRQGLPVPAQPAPYPPQSDASELPPAPASEPTPASEPGPSRSPQSPRRGGGVRPKDARFYNSRGGYVAPNRRNDAQ